ncbi:TonB-dependent siderophore receptor [Phenylobacterium sp. J367]|uniref:TonB-dependent siderophore receptor n=1 Tax=Phenylobacterium sp. J367 TaxID=2898435 RepID=UPI0021517C6A|nr:TonB-dependent receptor [Phenylobacterium sp. J367]MCR5879315.1 TonB-dependent receptor [Phenylobacterium sp. J367]
MSRLKAALLATVFIGSPALAQESAVRSAADAFGERVGIEQLGLYGEGQVRGFDLQGTGAYRIDDAYFARASPLNDPVLAGVGVRVGVNAARLAYPSPSGVVNYRLREPAATNSLTVGGGLRDYWTQTLEANGSWSTDDARFGVAGGFVWRPSVSWGPGTEGKAFDVGGVARWRITETQVLKAFVSLYDRKYDGDYTMKAAQPAVPPSPQPFFNYSPEWATVDAANLNFGAIYKGDLAGTSLDLSAFRSIYDADRQDFTVVSLDDQGNAFATLFLSPGKTNVSDSGEAKASRVFRQGDLSHLVSASGRWRKSKVDLATTVPVPIGAFDIDDAPPPSDEPVWAGKRGLDTVEQVTGSLGYGLVWKDRLQFRLGAHRTRYEKTVDTLSGVTTSGIDETTLWNASAIWSFNDRTSLFGSWVTGLEETGIAPNTATNRNEVLAPVEAEQFEVGVRHAVTSQLTFISALFDVSKPTTGFRPDGSFGLVGEVAHRGLEASLAGQLSARTSVVLGAVVFEPKVTGALVEAGMVGDEAIGISDKVANFNVEHQLGDGWSLDAQLSWYSARWADTKNIYKTPDVTLLNVGARRRFDLGGHAALFRVLASNVTGTDGYWASPSTQLWPIAPRTVRALISVTFG